MVRRVSGAVKELRQLDLHIFIKLADFESAVFRRRGRVLGYRQSFRLPLGKAAIQDEKIVYGEAVIIEIEKEPGGQDVAARIVHHYLFPGADSPRLEELFHLCV